MHRYENYWIVMLFRGALATIFGCAIVLIPQMSSSMLLLPFAMVLSVIFLAAYGAADSALVFFESFTLPSRLGQVATRLQGVFGVVIALLLMTLVMDHARLHWFFYLVAAHAGASAIADFMTARHVWRHHRTILVYATALISGAASLYFLLYGMLEAPDAPASTSSAMLYSYLLLFGVVSCGLACMMLQEKPQHRHATGAILPHAH